MCPAKFNVRYFDFCKTLLRVDQSIFFGTDVLVIVWLGRGMFTRATISVPNVVLNINITFYGDLQTFAGVKLNSYPGVSRFKNF